VLLLPLAPAGELISWLAGASAFVLLLCGGALPELITDLSP
jgi:hypothetical protein